MSNPLRSEAIKKFLITSTHSDLAALYTSEMEVQVMVAQDNGFKVDPGDYKGKNWQTFRDNADLNRWYSFRIPKNADSEPENNNSQMSYDLASHVEGIGLTGWNWVRKESIFLGFDFDAIIGHSDKHASKLTEDELKTVQDAIMNIPWATLRRSTSGNGLHVYVELVPTPTRNHTEHKALARAVLAQMAARANFDFNDKVDAFGGVLWIWHRKMKASNGLGLKLLKVATEQYTPPPYWEDHIDVIKRTRKKLKPFWLKDSDKETEDKFEAIASQMFETPLDEKHRLLIKWLEENNCVQRWDPEHHCLVTHTIHLKEAHEALGMKGPFETLSTGKNRGADWNCLSGETRILTQDGPKRISELSGKETKLYVRTAKGMRWIDCTVQSFGKQKTVPITFDDGSSVRATENHKWLFIDDSGKIDLQARKYTLQLKEHVTKVPVATKEKKFIGIRSIDFADIKEEEVFCAVVPQYHNFTLANYVITGNCYAHPIKKGAWAVRRFTQGTAEHSLWEQDGSGWTRCFLNVPADLDTAARMNHGVRRDEGGFAFDKGADGLKAAAMLGAAIKLQPFEEEWVSDTKILLKYDKTGRELKVHIEKTKNIEGISGWDNGKTYCKRLFPINVVSKPESEVIENYDDLIRHLIRDGSNKGWVIFNNQTWQDEPLEHVKHIIRGPLQKGNADMQAILGTCIRKAWTLCNMPFKAEYPEGRLWNRNAAQLAFIPTPGQDVLKYDHWLKILQHCGQNLDTAVKIDDWCQSNGILTGADYLKCWIANLFKEPTAPLPYLFFYGPENSGKSIFHEAISILLTTGYARADTALTSNGNFNGELENVIIAVIEETDLKKNRTALEKIKDWVTTPKIFIHKKNVQPYLAANTLHFVQCANNIDYCPILPGDSRITVIFVPEIEPDHMIPKRELDSALRKEAPDFLAAILNLELPICPDRLNLPVIETEEKKEAAEAANDSPLTIFLDTKTFEIPGKTIVYKEFYEELKNNFFNDRESLLQLGKKKVSHELRLRRMLARDPSTNQVSVLNRSFSQKLIGEEELPKLVIRGELFYPETLNGEQSVHS